MKSVIKTYLYNENGVKFFGEGPYNLLMKIDELGSLRKAAAEMNMAYTKALAMIKTAEDSLGFKLTEKTVGGKNGGGSKLTEQAKEFTARYATYRNECRKADSEIFNRCFCGEQ